VSARGAVLGAVLLLAPFGAFADDPRMGPLPPPGSDSGPRVTPPAPAPTPSPSSLDSQQRVLEMERALRDAQQDRRRSIEEQELLDQQDLQRLEEYKIRERRADDTRALEEELERRALERSGAPPVSDAEREQQRALERQERENRAGEIEDRIRMRQRPAPTKPEKRP
jgi:hypothetical protein